MQSGQYSKYDLAPDPVATRTVLAIPEIYPGFVLK